MKTVKRIVIAACAAVLSVQAATVFDANFNASTWVTNQTDTAAMTTNMNAGTSAGAWTVAMNSGTIETNITETGDMLLKYNNRGLLTANFSTNAGLAQGVSFNFRAGAENTNRWCQVAGLDSAGRQVFRLRLSISTADDGLGVYLFTNITATATNDAIFIGNSVKYAQIADKPWNTITLNITNNTISVSGSNANGVAWTTATADILTANAPDLKSIQILGQPTTQNVTMLFDNIKVTGTPLPPPVFYADFNNTTLDTVAKIGVTNGWTLSQTMNNATTNMTGAWSLETVHASSAFRLMPTTSSNRVLYWYSRAHSLTGTLSSASSVSGSNSVLFSCDFRPNSSASTGTSEYHWMDGYSSTGEQLFRVAMSQQAVDNYLVTVNGTSTSNAYRNAGYDTPINAISLHISSNGIDVVMVNRSTAVTTVVNAIPLLNAASDFAWFTITSTAAKNTAFDYDNFRALAIGSAAPPANPYDTWAGSYGLVQGPAGDDDLDGQKNLLEYALGGNPTNGTDAASILPTPGMVQAGGTNWLQYVYRRRTDYPDRGLTYYLELNTNLVTGVWTNSGYTVTGTGPLETGFEAVSNRVSTAVKSKQFLRLKVIKN
jgi:hypothetical protein